MKKKDMRQQVAHVYDISANQYKEEWGAYWERLDKGKFNGLFLPNVRPFGKLVDVGCGAGVQLLTVQKERPDLSFLGIDGSSGQLTLARKALPNGQFQEELLPSLSLPDSYFDGLVCRHVLHHLTDAEQIKQGIEELARVLSDGGVAYVSSHISEKGTEMDMMYLFEGEELWMKLLTPMQYSDMFAWAGLRNIIEPKIYSRLEKPGGESNKNSDVLFILQK